MANDFVTAEKKGEVSKVKGYDSYGGLRVRHAFTGTANYSDNFIEIPALPEMIKVTATTEVKMTFANDKTQVKAKAVFADPQNPTPSELADVKELEDKGIDNIGLDEREDIIIVPAGQEVTYRKRHEKFIAFKGNGVFEAW